MGLRGYALCASPRSGADYLCQLLASTGALGRPLDYFNGPGRRAAGAPDYPDDPLAQFRIVTGQGSTPNGVYGLKLFAFQADMAEGADWPTALPGLSFVWLRRSDLLGQAMSWARAEQTDSYRSTIAPHCDPVFDCALISRRLRHVVREDARWSLYFARTGIAPLTLDYDSVAADPQGAVDAVAALMEVSPSPAIDPARVDLRIQRDALTDAWRARFIEESGDRRRVDTAGGRKA